jgi:hypothetical protein
MMRKISVVILFLLATLTAANAQTVMYTQSFEDTASLFQDYVLSKLDNGIPAEAGLDTLQSVPWYVSTAGASGNHAAIATSNYDPSVAASDWFITPQIRIGKASKFTWKSLSLSSGKTDTYQVYVSTTEQSVSGCEFNGVTGSYTSDNSASFVTHTLDLAAAGYSNQFVYIGFKLNTQSGGDKIAIDDLNVTEDSTHFVSLRFMVDMTNYIQDTLFDPRTDTVDIAGTFNNYKGTKDILSIVPDSDSALYSITIPGFLDGDQLEFKFRINSTWNDSTVEFPYGQPNRVWTIEPGKYTYTCFYNDVENTTFGIPENKLMDQVNVYPNPAQNEVAVETPPNINRILLVSFTGTKIIDQETHTGSISRLNLSTVSRGSYLLLFYTNQGFAGSKKLIKY